MNGTRWRIKVFDTASRARLLVTDLSTEHINACVEAIGSPDPHAEIVVFDNITEQKVCHRVAEMRDIQISPMSETTGWEAGR